jgi:RND superfamily putative drug exporter
MSGCPRVGNLAAIASPPLEGISMARHLYRLGGWAFDHRRSVLAAWLVVLAVVFGASAAFSGKTTNAFSVPGTESQQAQDLLDQKFPGAGGGTARMVFAAPAGESLMDADNRAAVEASLAKAAKAGEVSTVVDPYKAKTITPDGKIGFADVVYPVPADKLEDASRDQLEATADPAREAGLQVEFGGGVVLDESKSQAESAGMMIAFVVLAMTLGSLLAAGLPLLTAGLGVITGVTALTALTGVIEMSKTAPILATMLGLAVGIDYALFILSRHRQNVDDGMDVREAAANATATAGSAVVFAGLTVIIALVGLAVVNIPFLTVMGLAAAGTVTIAVLIALTLLPALLGFVGERITRRNRVLSYRLRRRAPKAENASVRWARFVTKRPVPVIVVGLALLGTLAIPATHMKLGLPDDGSRPSDSTAKKAYDLLTEGFGPGFNGPLTVVVDAPKVPADQQKQLASAVADGLEKFPNVAAVSPAIQNEKGDLTIVSVTPKSGPASDETKDLVTVLRDKADVIRAQSGIEAYVTGTTAVNIDTADRLSAALPKYVVVVVGLALLLLTIVFRSVLVPIKAAAGFLLSIGAAMGVVVWIFQDGNMANVFNLAEAGPIVSFLPVLLIGILFGLAMDYEVFLVSRMREQFTHTGRARESIITGFGQSGRVVVAAALIMVGVFGGFVLDPDPVVKSIGLALAVGVLADAFVVRLTLVPAAMALMGRHAWRLPRRLGRVLPDLDIEGAKLAPEAR